MPKGNMIEQDQVLMQLSHVSYMRNDRDAEFPA